MKLSTYVAIAIAMATCTSCSSFGTPKAIVGDVIDCTTEHVRTLTDQFAPLVDELLRHATGADGKVDWVPVKDATRSFAVDSGGCVLAHVIARALAPRPPPDPNAPKIAGLETDTTALLAGFHQLYPGKRFRTALGDL